MNLSDKLRKLIHPILLKVLPKKDFTVQLINEVPYVKGNKIYVMNHSNKHDGPVSCESIQEHVFLLVGKQALEFVDRIFFFLNGVVYVDRKDKDSKKRGSEKMLQILQRGNSLLLCPEGTWNNSIVEKIKKLQNVILEFFGDGDYVPTIFKVRKEFPMAKSGKRDTVKMKAETEGFFTIDK